MKNEVSAGKREGGISAREIAAHALGRVWQEAAFASAALDTELSRARVEPREAALATELCYGVLRVEPALITRLAKVSERFRAPSGLVRAHLLMGAYAICFLDRVPAFAAVSEAVEASRRVADARVGGFVNAVLRRLATDVEKNGRPLLADFVVETCPWWLRKALGQAIGKGNVRAYLTEGAVPPPLGLCLADASQREASIDRFIECTPVGTFSKGAASPRAVLVKGAGDLRKLPGYGLDFITQEEGAQVLALGLGARTGERVLDACAGHGNKAWVLAHEVGSEGAADAADLYPLKLRALERSFGAAMVRPKTFVVDWQQGRGEVPDDYDRVLVDAPCSGTGTLRRRPEIALRRSEADVARLAELQVAILRNAASCVRDGGRIVYAVCSVLREEAEAVVEAAIAAGATNGATLTPEVFDSPVIEALFGEATAFRLLPHVHGTDGYFAASLRVTRAR